MFRSKLIIILLLLNLVPVKLFGQACCSGSVPISNFVGIRPSGSGQLTIRTFHDGNYLSNYYSGTEKLNGTSVSRWSQSLFLQGIYGVNDRFAINLMGTYVIHTLTSKLNSGTEDKTKIRGLGDAILILQYKVLNRPTTNLYITLGPKLPIGESGVLDKNGLLAASDLQPGTGSWDLVSGLGFLHSGFLRPTVNITATLIGKFNSYSNRFGTAQKYKYGNDYQLLAGITDSYLINNTTINPGFLVRVRHTAQDRIDEGFFPNTGGLWVFLVPSLNANLMKNLWTFISVEIPVYQNLTGTQLSTTLRFNLGLQVVFAGKQNMVILE